MTPEYLGEMQPAHPCREMSTRHCPPSYGDVCGDRPCARFESDDVAPWAAVDGLPVEACK